MAKTPKIRFKNFSDEWNAKILGEICEYKNGKSYEPFICDNGKYNLITLNSIDINGKLKIEHKKILNADEFLIKDDLVIVLSDIAIGSFLGLTAIIPNNNTYVLNQRMGLLRKTINLNAYFLSTLINSKQKYFFSIGQGTSQKNLSKFGVLNLSIKIPKNIKEQEKIGAFFSKLDKLISLHQSKFEKLQKIKKSCLQNLFPQNNQNTPKIRFKNFTDEWMENKYKNIGQCLSGGTLSYEDLDKNGIYKCILYGELYTRYDYIIKNIVFRTNKLGNKVIKNDILFPQSTTVDAISLISPACMNDDEAQTSGVFAIRPHKNIDGNFITYYTKGNFYQRNKLAKNAQGLTIVHLYYQSIKDETILIPNLAEQCKISEFFTKLDKLITLHQSKFEKLQKIKKSCLQNMFV